MIFAQKRIVITRSGNGVGKRTAQRLLEQGARVMINDTETERLKETETELKNLGEVHVSLADCRRLNEMETLAQSALFKLGGVDIWINNSNGVSNYTSFYELEPGVWKAEIEENLMGVFNGCKAILPHFYEKKAGRIVNAVFETEPAGQQGLTTYAANMAAIVEFTKALAMEAGKFNVFINSVSLGRTLAENHQMIETAYGQEKIDKLKSQFALQRLGNLDDAANALMFMASDQASWITGQNLKSNGGFQHIS